VEEWAGLTSLPCRWLRLKQKPGRIGGFSNSISAFISVHQRSGCFISVHPRLSAVGLLYQRSSAFISVYQRSSAVGFVFISEY
jgi:hypothetical protein